MKGNYFCEKRKQKNETVNKFKKLELRGKQKKKKK